MGRAPFLPERDARFSPWPLQSQTGPDHDPATSSAACANDILAVGVDVTSLGFTAPTGVPVVRRPWSGWRSLAPSPSLVSGAQETSDLDVFLDRSQPHAGLERVDLIKETEHDLDPHHVETQIGRQPANPSQTCQLGRAEHRGSPIVHLRAHEPELHVAAYARGLETDHLSRGLDSVVAAELRALAYPVHVVPILVKRLIRNRLRNRSPTERD